MNKTSIEKVLTKGTPKKRAILLANHIAEINLDGKGLLSDEEFNRLSNSFKSDKEIEVYNRYRNSYDKLRIFLSNLSEIRTSFALHVSRVEHLVSLKKKNANIEDLSNTLLNFIKDKKERKKAVLKIKNFSTLEMDLSADKEGFIFYDKTFIETQLKRAKEDALERQVELKTGITLAKEFMSKEGLNIKVFTAFIKDCENWAKSPWEPFSEISYKRKVNQAPSSLKALISKTEKLGKTYSEAEINEELYEHWRGDFL